MDDVTLLAEDGTHLGLLPKNEMDDVTLLAEDGTHLGLLPKNEVHTFDTPLHLAFSCYVLDGRGRVLVTRRALGKQTWPGVWTNSFCGHPRPGEAMITAVERRGNEELGARISSVRVVLPDFRYRAVDSSGIVENEICPVHVARIEGEVAPDPVEVAEWAWLTADDLHEALSRAPFAFSPWMRAQLPQLRDLGEV